MKPVIDVSAQISASNTVFNTTARYRYTPPTGQWLLITELSIVGDSTFQTDGRLQIVQGGNIITSGGAVPSSSEIALLRLPVNFVYPFEAGNILYPNQALEVYARTAGSTGICQVALTGMLLNADEFAAYQKKWGLVQ